MPNKSEFFDVQIVSVQTISLKSAKEKKHWFLKIFFGKTEKTDNQHYSKYPYVIYPNKDKNLMKLLNLNAVIT